MVGASIGGVVGLGALIAILVMAARYKLTHWVGTANVRQYGGVVARDGVVAAPASIEIKEASTVNLGENNLGENKI